ncbi:MAG: EMC3/TMCO1 family protein [archaeon]
MTLSEVMIASPRVSIAVVSVIVTFVSTLAHKWLTNQEHMKSLKARQKEIQKELRGCKDVNIMKELNAEMMKLTGVMMKSSFRPMFVTIIPFLILFAWLRNIFTPTMSSMWIWYYLGFSIVASIILRKIMRVA